MSPADAFFSTPNTLYGSGIAARGAVVWKILDEENTDCFLLVASHRTRLSVDEVGEAW